MKKIFLIVFLASLVLFLNSTLYAKDGSQSQIKALNLASEFLNDEKLTAKYVDGFNDPERFVIVEGESIGYLIYDSLNDIYLEYSNDDYSPYKSIEDKLLYIAPTYYYYQKNNKIYDIFSEKEYTWEIVEQLKAFDIDYKEMLRLKVENSNNEEKEEPIKKKLSFDSPIYQPHNHDDREYSSPPSGATYSVPYSFYFENLKANILYNDDESCSLTAVGMLLSYYDSVISDDILLDQFEANTTVFFQNYNYINTQVYTESPGVYSSLKDDFLIQTNGDRRININQQKDLVEHYFDNANINYSSHLSASNSVKSTWVKNGIASGNPTIINFDGIDTDVFNPSTLDKYLNHSVVGYEYNDSGIFVNFGWGGGTLAANPTTPKTKVNIHNFTIYSALNYTINQSHSHISNYLWMATNGTTGTLCICGIKECLHSSTNIDYFSDNTTHEMYCHFCLGFMGLHSHTFVDGVCSVCGYHHLYHTLANSNLGTPSSHFRICTTCYENVYCPNSAQLSIDNDLKHRYSCDCGFYKVENHNFDNNNTCTICGFYVSHIHNYTNYYSDYSDTQHKSYCDCGLYVYSVHVGRQIGNIIRCISCNHLMTGGFMGL